MNKLSQEIHVLDEITINKIAAGEVVDKPASVVKELIENSLDAGATQITIEILNGGKDLIKVSDNGCGIKEAQIEFAFMRHATSKIHNIDDLELLQTNGFRGEALSAISAISKVEIITKTQEDIIGVKSLIENSKVVESNNFGARQGTSISISDLFYNVPARKKFLKDGSKEAIQITDIISRLALINTHCGFRYIVDGKIGIETNGENSLESTIDSIYGKSYLKNLTKVDYQDEIISLSGYISNSSLYASSRKKQNLYINKRYVKMPSIMYAIENAYKELIPIGKFPVYILNVDTSAKNIDPNIHPAKIEVKIAKEVHIEEALQKIVKNTLFKTSNNLIPEIQDFSKYSHEVISPEIIRVEEKNFELGGFEYKEEVTKEVEIIIHKELETPNIENVTYSDILKTMVAIENEEEIDKPENINLTKDILYPNEEGKQEVIFNGKIYEDEDSIVDFTKLYVQGIIFETYIFATLKDDLYLIDQHAAHERIQYEKFINMYNLDQIGKAKMNLSQELLIPEIIDLTFEENQLLWKKIEIFRDLGYVIDEFGSKSVAIRSFPLILDYTQNQDFFYYILNTIIEDDKIDLNERFKDKLAKKACRSAVKAHQKINQSEIQEIFKNLNKCKNKYTCPHGRPIFVKLGKYQLEKMFKRVSS